MSNQSYIVESVALRLGLPLIASNTLQISAFGDSQPRKVSSCAVRFGILQRDHITRAIIANAVSIINNSTPSEPLPKEELTILRGVKYALADDVESESSGSIDILLGADYVWDFIIGGKIQPSETSNIYLIPSTLGLLLAGQASSIAPEEAESCTALACIAKTDINGSAGGDTGPDFFSTVSCSGFRLLAVVLTMFARLLSLLGSFSRSVYFVHRRADSIRGTHDPNFFSSQCNCQAKQEHVHPSITTHTTDFSVSYMQLNGGHQNSGGTKKVCSDSVVSTFK
jgi:hypothetical protein